MKTFSYVDNEASQARLEELRIEFESATADQKYNRYRAWLHYANLERWRNQGHHFFYLTMYSASNEKLVCTCGLAVMESDFPKLPQISKETRKTLSELELDCLQILKGHRDFETKEPVSAIIVKYFVVGEDSYKWACFCQSCGLFESPTTNKAAKKFCKRHNEMHS